MSNLLTREARTTTPQTPVLEPFRMMRELMRWDPYRDNLMTLETQTFMPSFEVKETPTAYVFKADLPGIKEEDLDIQLLGNRLTIGGKRETEKKEDNETWHVMERSYGSFSRSFTLPEEIAANKVDAHLVNGVLTLTVMKNPEAQPQKIRIKS
ncbi:MAG TPA: HSP20 family small heat-shock protein [Holophagaceae bacterium]|nr:HSP20 family small heat-shock protein [Holophagaceae bacterium]